MKPVYKKYQLAGSYSFSEALNCVEVYGYDTYEEAVAAASMFGCRDCTYVVEVKATVKPIRKPVDVIIEEFSNEST